VLLRKRFPLLRGVPREGGRERVAFQRFEAEHALQPCDEVRLERGERDPSVACLVEIIDGQTAAQLAVTACQSVFERLGEVGGCIGDGDARARRLAGSLSLQQQRKTGAHHALGRSHVADERTWHDRRRDRAGARLIGEIVPRAIVVRRRFAEERHTAQARIAGAQVLPVEFGVRERTSTHCGNQQIRVAQPFADQRPCLAGAQIQAQHLHAGGDLAIPLRRTLFERIPAQRLDFRHARTEREEARSGNGRRNIRCNRNDAYAFKHLGADAPFNEVVVVKRSSLLLLFVVAAAAGWFLLRPLPHRAPPQPVAEATATLLAATAPPATPLETASPAPSRPPAAAPSGAKLALIIDDCGQWVDIERGYIALPIPITLSILPHVHAAAEIAKEAHDAGKGVMLHLPMEPLSEIYPGPGEVKTSMTDAQVTAQVEDDLAAVPLVQGVNNHEGSKASADPRVMRDVMRVLAQHGNLFFIDSRTNAASVGEQEAKDAGIPAASRDVFLDNKENVAYTEAQLRDAAAIALRTGSAIAIGHPRATTLEAVRAMIPQLQAQGITFVLAGSLTH